MLLMTLLTIILHCNTRVLDCRLGTVSSLLKIHSLCLFLLSQEIKTCFSSVWLLFSLKTLMYLNIRRDHISSIAANTSEALVQCLRLERISHWKRPKFKQNSFSTCHVSLTIRLHKRQQFCANIPGSIKVCLECNLSLDCKWSGVINWS